MTVTINGATGIAGVNGSAALPAVQGDDTNTGVFYPAADTVAITTGGTERMRINASGQAEFTAGTTALPAITATGDTNTGMFFPAADVVGIVTNGTERMRIDSSGIITGTAGNLMLVSGTAQASTSGTSIDFTSIPSWVKRITVMFDGVSLSGTSSFLAQIGDSGGIEITGYNGGGSRLGVSTLAGATFTAGFGFNNSTAACLFSGNIIFCNVTGNTWSASGLLGGSATEFSNTTSGSKTLSGTLDRVRITTVNGTDTFDAGSINIMYE